MSSIVMAGPLRDFDVAALLQAVGLSRQYTLIRLWNRDKEATGELRLKAGHLLDAEESGQRGPSAFYAILRSGSHHSFRVERLDEPVNLPEPVGLVAQLLLAMPDVPDTSPDTNDTPDTNDAPDTNDLPDTNHVDDDAPTPVPGETPRIAASYSRPTAVAFPSTTLTKLGSIEGLRVVLLVSVAQERCYARWHRSSVPLPIAALAGLATQWIRAYRHNVSDRRQIGRTTVELPEGTFLLEPLDEARVAAYLFDDDVPQGLVRWHARRLDAMLSPLHPDPPRA